MVLVGLANPEWLVGAIGYPVLVGTGLMLTSVILWLGLTITALFSSGSTVTGLPGVRWTFWSYCALTALIGLMFGVWLSTKQTLSCQGYGIAIVSPEPGDSVQEEGSYATGTFTTMPPDEHLVLFMSPVDRAYYYPQYEVNFDPLHKQWIGQLGKMRQGEESILSIAILGNSGQILYDHYWTVAREANSWIPFRQLTEDTIICDEVQIRGPSE